MSCSTKNLKITKLKWYLSIHYSVYLIVCIDITSRMNHHKVLSVFNYYELYRREIYWIKNFHLEELFKILDYLSMVPQDKISHKCALWRLFALQRSKNNLINQISCTVEPQFYFFYWTNGKKTYEMEKHKIVVN